MVKKEKPAGEGGQYQDKVTENNIDKNQKNVKELPAWAIRKITMLAQERQRTHGETLDEAVYKLEWEALTVLEGELGAFPDLASLVPADFLERMRRGRLALSDHERGIVLLVDADAKAVLPTINLTTDMEDFLKLKWHSLGAIIGGAYA